MEAITLRRFSSGGVSYAKGAKIKITDGQFADWKAVGLVKSVPLAKPAKAAVDTDA